MKKKPDNQNKDNQKANKLYAWSHLIRSISKFLWIIVVVIILATLGKIFIFNSKNEVQKKKNLQKPVVEKIDWSTINSKIETIIVEARAEAQKLAEKKLDLWIEQNMIRVDNDFLDWYFGYWTQQKLGLKGLLAQVWHWVDSDSPNAAEKITEDVQEEFSNRVIRPQIAQMEIERMIQSVVQRYSLQIKKQLQQIPKTYQIKQSDWDRYLNDISTMVTGTEGNRSVSLSLKVLAGATAGGSIFIMKTFKPMISKIGSKISTKLAAKRAAKMAAKTGGKVAVKAGGKFAGTIISIGIIIWDVWDHHNTKKKAKPVLRKNIYDYFSEMKQSILHDSEFGIMIVLYDLEKGLLKQLNRSLINSP